MESKPSQRLGEFELVLLLSITALGNGAYGAALAREIEDQTGRTVSFGSVYKTLDRLQDKNYLEASVGLPKAERGGRRRKVFRLTTAGNAALQRSLADIDALRARAGTLFNNTAKGEVR